ncbi:MAG: PadR family transcriptional regulator [Micromonosporaceae bacterium]
MNLREPSFLILTAIAATPRHGYGIIQEVAALSEGRVKLQAGTLYTALERLTGEGLIAVDREEVVGGRLRRYYKITDVGASRLAAEAERLESNAAAARRSLSTGSGAPGPSLARIATAPAA